MRVDRRLIWWLWSAVVVVGCGLIFISVESGDLGCELGAADSLYGHFSWSWFPRFGSSCVWSEELHGVDHRDDPSWIGTLWLVVGIAGLVRLTPVARRSV